MESHNRNKRGRRIMEEPQHRPSPIAKTCHSTSESYELERTSSKIQHTREHVESLKQRIDYELDKLKKFRDYFVKVGDSERSVKKPVSKVVQRKHTTWRENLEANRTRRNRLGGIPGEIKRVVAVKSSPESGNSKESPHKKGPTPPEKYTPKPTPKDKESGEKRPTGGWCWCCGQCSYPCSVYQGSYGSPCNGACDCDCITNGCCNWNPDQQYPLQDCREVSPHQECRFGIPYRVFPRQTANRKVSDLNTEEYLRNAKDCAAMMPDRAKKPIKKCQRSPSTGSKRTESSGRAKSPIGVAMLKLDKKCTKIQEKKLEKLCEKPVKKEQRTIKKEVKREQRTLEKPVKKEPKCTWENDRKIKDENYENYIRMYEQENCRDIPPECADNKGPSPCNIKGRTYPQVEKCPFENQPSSLMDSDKIREKIRKLIDLKNFRGHQRAEEKPNSCETYNEPRNLPDLGRENSEIQICLPYWCTDHIPCNAQQENSCESFDEALNRKCLEEMAREKGNPKMECNYFMEGGPTGTCPEDPCVNQNPSNTSLFNLKSSFEIENHRVLSRKTCECRRETLVRQQPRNERSLPSHYAGQLREPCLGSRAYQYKSDSPERRKKAQTMASCRKECPSQTEPQNMCEKASQVNMVRKYQRDTGGSQKRSAQPDKNSFGFRSGAETKRKFESPHRKKIEKDCDCSSRAQGNSPREAAAKKEKPQHIYKKEMSKQSYTDDCNHQQPNRTFERRPREKHRGGSPQASYDQAGRFQKELCKGLSKHVVCGKETLASNMPTSKEDQSSSQPSSDSHEPYTSFRQPKWKENSRECNQSPIPFQKRKGSYDYSYSPHEERNTPPQEPCSQRTRNTPKYSQERQDYGDSYTHSGYQERDTHYKPFNQNLKRELPNQTINSKDFYTTLPSFRNQRDCERQYDECMRRESVSQRKEPYNPQGLSKDTRSSPCEPGNRGNQRELKESSTDSNVGFNYQLKYHPSGFLSPLKGRHNGSYHPESGPCHSQRCNCERCVAQSRNQRVFNKSYQNQNNDYMDQGSPVDRYKSMTRSTPPNFSYFYQVSDDPKNTKRNPDNDVAYSPNRANYTNKCGEEEYEGSYKKSNEERPPSSQRAPNYSARNLEKTFVQDSYKKWIPDSYESRQNQQRSQNENRQNRERSPYKGRVTSRSLSPTKRESLDYFQAELNKSLMKDSHKDMKPKSIEDNFRNKNEECREDDSRMNPLSSRKEYTSRDPNEVRPFSRNASPIRSQDPPGYLKREVEESAIKDLCKEPESREPERHIKHGASREADGRIKQKSREVGSHKHESTREEVTPIEEKTFKEKYRPQRHPNELRSSSRNDGPSRCQAAVEYFQREIGESLKDSQMAVQPESFEAVDRKIKHESARETDRHIKPESSRKEHESQRHPKKEGQSSRGTSPIKGQSFDHLKEDHGQSLKDSHKDVKPETLNETKHGPLRKQNSVSKERRPPSRSPSPKKRQVVDGFNREMRESLLEGLSYPKSLTYPDRQMQLSSPNRSPREDSSARRVFNKLRSTSKSTSPDRDDSKRPIKTLVNDSYRKLSPDSHREEKGTSPESQRIHKVSSNDSYAKFTQEISNFTRQRFPEQYRTETGTPRSFSPNRSVPGLEKSNRTMRQELMKDAHKIVNPGSSKEANRLVNQEPLDVSHREAGPDDSSLLKKSPNDTYTVGNQEMVNKSNSYEEKLASRRSRSLSVLDEMRQLDDELDESYRELPESLKEPKVHRVASTTFTDTCSDATVIKGPDHSSNQRINNSPNRQSRQSRSRSSSPMRSHASLNDSIRQMRESLIHSSHSQLPGTFQQVKSRVSSPHRSPREMREAILNNSYQRESPRRFTQESPTESPTPVAYQSPDEHRHASGHDREPCRGPYADSDEDAPNYSYQHFKQKPPVVKSRPSSSPYRDFDSHPEWLETFESCDRPDDVCGSSRSFSPRRNTSTDGTYSLPASYRSTSPCKSHTSDPYPRDNSSSSTECHDEQRECFEFQSTCEDNEPPRASCLACQENDESYSEMDTVCEKSDRCVTFNDEDCSVIDWDRVLLEDGEEDQSVGLPHTCRSSSSADHTCRESIYGSAEHTCTESVCGDDCASGRQRDYGIPTFEACPCMYQTYLSLAAMCQSNERYIQ